MKYVLTHKATPVLTMTLDEDTGAITRIDEIHAPGHVPIGVPCTGSTVDRKMLNAWWSGRSIPANRAGLKEALETLKVTSSQLLLTKCFGLSLSDQYWVCPEGSGLKWGDIHFFDHSFSDDVGNILFGKVPDSDGFNLMSPDNTSDGWLRKKWVVVDGKRLLVKGGSGAIRQEPYNEVLASAVMRRLGIEHIPYTLTLIDEYPYSVCEGFITRDTELVAAHHILKTQKKPTHATPYQHYSNCCEALGISGIVKTLDHMLTLDFIIANDDRHLNNFGAIRDAETLIWVGPAPIYDCGTSMWCNEPTAMVKPFTKLPSKPFKPCHSEQITLVKSFDWLDLPSLQGIDEEFREILSDSAFIDTARRDVLCSGLLKRIELLGTHIKPRDGRIKQRSVEQDIQSINAL